MTDGADGLCGDVLVESDSECRQVQVAVDAAELVARLDHAGCAPAQGHDSSHAMGNAQVCHRLQVSTPAKGSRHRLAHSCRDRRR